ncbi:VOC family protein [Ornithinimicrobium pratense]|uniref:VOC family protein n=1 Tax=Ornithinimicrobium pratense TaxID=2593973 RepID=A0A5J6V7H3_9MICO|nr:VOC family protein [Ornithinimicrobium pratense]QFG69033.1 VOC family protein [Ornithinimicrobium pratense]
MIRIGAIVLNTADPERAGAFWSHALGYDRATNPDFLVPQHSGASRFHLDRTDRTHLDLWTDSKAEQRAEVERLISLGATRVDWDYPEDADFIVLADPTGNLFCVIDIGAPN